MAALTWLDILTGSASIISITVGLITAFVTHTHPILSKTATLRMIKYMALCNVASTIQFPFVFTTATDHPWFCTAQAVQTQFSFFSWIGLHATIGLDIIHQVRASSLRFFFVREWMTVVGIFLAAFLSTMWMLLPCGDAVGKIAVASRLCWIQPHSTSHCRLLLFDLPLLLAWLFNLYVLVLAVRMLNTKQLGWNGALLSYMVWYTAAFAAIFFLFLIQEGLLIFTGSVPPALADAQLLVVVSHGIINGTVFFFLWANVKSILGDHRCLPSELRLGDLRRLQEWEELMKHLTGRTPHSRTTLYSSTASSASLFSLGANTGPFSLSSTVNTSTASSSSPSSSLHIPFARLYPDKMRAHRDAIDLVDREQLTDWRELFYFEQLKVSGAESTPLLGPHLLDHSGDLTLVNPIPSLSCSRILKLQPCNPWAPKHRKTYNFRLVGDTLYYFLTTPQSSTSSSSNESTPFPLPNEDNDAGGDDMDSLRSRGQRGATAFIRTARAQLASAHRSQPSLFRIKPSTRSDQPDDDATYAGSIPLDYLVSVIPIPPLDDSDDGSDGFPIQITALVESPQFVTSAIDTPEKLAYMTQSQLEATDDPLFSTKTWVLEAPTERERSIWIAALSDHRPSGVTHIEEIDGGGNPQLRMGHSNVAIARTLLQYPNWLMDAEPVLDAILAHIENSVLTFLLDIYAIYLVYNMGYFAQESVWASATSILQQFGVDGTLEEYAFHPSRGWGESGYGARTRLALPDPDSAARVLQTLQADTQLLADVGAADYSLNIISISIPDWVTLNPQTRADLVDAFESTRFVHDPVDDVFFGIRIVGYLPEQNARVGTLFASCSSALSSLACCCNRKHAGDAYHLSYASNYADFFVRAVTENVFELASSPSPSSSAISSPIPVMDASSSPNDDWNTPGERAPLLGTVNGPVAAMGAFVWDSLDEILGHVMDRTVRVAGTAVKFVPSIFLVVTIAAMLATTTASTYVLQFYTKDIQAKTFHIQESDVFWVKTASESGRWFGLLSGLAVERFGPRRTVLVSGVVVAIGYAGCFAMSFNSVPTNVMGLSLCLAGISIASYAIQLSALWTAMVLLQFSWSSTMIGTLQAMSALGGGLQGALFRMIDLRLTEVFFSLMVGTLVVSWLGALLPSRFNPTMQAEARLARDRGVATMSARLSSASVSIMRDRSYSVGLARKTEVFGTLAPPSTRKNRFMSPDWYRFSSTQPMAWGHLFSSVQFWHMFLVALLVKGVTAAVVSYISAIEYAAKRDSNVLLAYALFALGHFAGSLFMGNIVQAMPWVHHSYAVIVLSTAMSVAHLTLSYAQASMIEFGLAATGIFYGAVDALIPIMVRDAFSINHFPVIYACVSVGEAIGAGVADGVKWIHIQSQSAHCVGPDCFRPLILCAAVACLVAIGVGIHMWRWVQRVGSGRMGGGGRSTIWRRIMASHDSLSASVVHPDARARSGTNISSITNTYGDHGYGESYDGMYTSIGGSPANIFFNGEYRL